MLQFTFSSFLSFSYFANAKYSFYSEDNYEHDPWNFICQSHWRFPCFVCGIGAIQIHLHVHNLPACLSSPVLWNHVDTYCRNIVSTSVFPFDKHKRTPSSKGLPPSLSSGARCSWVWRNYRTFNQDQESLSDGTFWVLSLSLSPLIMKNINANSDRVLHPKKHKKKKKNNRIERHLILTVMKLLLMYHLLKY